MNIKAKYKKCYLALLGMTVTTFSTFGIFGFTSSIALASEANVQLSEASINLNDEASLQRGAKYFMNLCSGCHSAEYMRYSRMAKDIKLTDTEGELLTDSIKTNLMFNTTDINSHIKSGMTRKDAQGWFGEPPPDLTMVTRVRGGDWVYTYLKSFYIDPNRPWGVNNNLFKSVAMPNVLEEYQGQQELVGHDLKMVKPGKLDAQQFDIMVSDITNFLSYTAEPYRADRLYLGVWVLLFLSVLFIFAFLMKKEYWKDVKKR